MIDESKWWWKRRPMRRIAGIVLRHGWKFVKKVEPLVCGRKKRQLGYEIEKMPKLSRVKDKATFARNRGWILSRKQTNMRLRGLKCECCTV